MLVLAMATTRTYGDGCAIAHALDLIGERWALLVIRELVLGPKRYTDLSRGLPNASPNVLSERLRELERAGIVERRVLAPPAASRVYELTDRGRELEEIVVRLGHWGARSPTLPSDAPIGADSMILALRSRFDPRAADGLRARYDVRLGEDRFEIEIADDEIAADRGTPDRADAIIDTNPDTLAHVLWGGRSLADAQRAEQLTITGDKAAARRFLRAVSSPASDR